MFKPAGVNERGTLPATPAPGLPSFFIFRRDQPRLGPFLRSRQEFVVQSRFSACIFSAIFYGSSGFL
jgi:hypothetical protein